MKKNIKKPGQQTLAIHAGESPDGQTGASSPNIAMSSTYVVEEPISFSVNNMDEDTPFIYSRWSNPTVRQLEEKLCQLDNAEQCIALASGMAASAGVLFSMLRPGDHLIISNTNYPGTAEISREHLPSIGVEVTPVDSTNLTNIEQAVQANTKMIWVETPSNPLLRLTDIKGVVDIAHRNNALLAVDATFASPIGLRPLDYGADLVVHSLTKYIGGHGDALGGCILGSKKLISKLRAGGVMHYGGVISPFNAWLIMRGASTLPIRMRCHQENALALADYLHNHPNVDHVFYPGHESHPQYQLAKSQMNNFSGMMSFKISNPHEVAKKMMNHLSIIHYAVSLGHHRSLIFLMDSEDLINSSYKLQGEELEKFRLAAGDGLFRFSVGLEDAEDLISDLESVL